MDGTEDLQAETPALTPLKVLLQVQGKDIELEQISYKRRELPARRAVEALQARRRELEKVKARVEVSRSELEERRAEIDARVEILLERIGQIDARLLSADSAGSYRDQQAMGTERDSLNDQRLAAEDDEIEVMELIEPVDQRLAEIAAELAANGDDTAAVQAQLAIADSDLAAAASVVVSSRASLAAELPAELAAIYERLRTKLGGVGAAKLVGGACGGCHLTLPSRERDQLLTAPVGQVFYCEQCGRILVP